MDTGSVGTNPYAQLQSAIESAKQRSGEVEQKQIEPEKKVRTPRNAGGGSLFQRLYGNSASKRESKPVQLGVRFDMYA